MDGETCLGFGRSVGHGLENPSKLTLAVHGIVVPLLQTADDAKKLIQSAKFPPFGARGFGSPFPMEKFGNISQTQYLEQANESLVTIVQIETQEALQNVGKCTHDLN